MDYLTEYSGEWPESFRRIESYLRLWLPKQLRIEHVGGTSLAGMPAKPIIDMDIIAPDGEIARIISAVERAGYTHVGNQDLPGREVFKPSSTETKAFPQHHLYACEESALELRKHLAFRDYLLAHPEDFRLLAEMKRHLAFERQVSRAEYIEGKSPLVTAITARALNWYH